MNCYLFTAGLAALLQTCLGIQILSHDGACKVQTDQGSIDLTPLGRKDNTPSFAQIPSYPGSYMTYDWNPCYDFNEDPQHDVYHYCQQVAVCRITSAGGYPYSAGQTYYASCGNTQSANFSIINGDIILQYQDTVTTVVTKITLLCSQDADSVTFSSDTIQTLQLTLHSKHACLSSPDTPSTPGGLSAGSIMCIVLLVIVSVYLVSGLMYMTVVRKASGKGRLTHITVLAGVPGLVKDGILFILPFKSGSKSPAAAAYGAI